MEHDCPNISFLPKALDTACPITVTSQRYTCHSLECLCILKYCTCPCSGRSPSAITEEGGGELGPTNGVV